MIVLGISEAHDAHACIMIDGRVVAAVAEERLTKTKCDSRYPRRAIEAVLGMSGVTPEQIDCAAFAANSSQLWHTIYNKHARFSVKDWIEECEIYWKPKLLDKKDVSPFIIADRFSCYYENLDGFGHYYDFLLKARDTHPDHWEALGDLARQKTISDHLGLPANKVATFRHEDCHKHYGWLTCPFRDEEAIILTLEGGGDDSSATASLSKKDCINEIWKSNDVHVGRLYAYMTLLLGMKPGQHEYKVMGLAPYGNKFVGGEALEIFRKIHHQCYDTIQNSSPYSDLYFSIKDELEGKRFDGIAWALQTWTEEILCKWVIGNIRKHGIHNVILSGGVAQNIKAVKAVADLPEVRKVWAGPISGDGSLGIGSAILATKMLAPDLTVPLFENIYLGTQYDDSDILKEVQKQKIHEQFKVKENWTANELATKICNGSIVARFSGNMEFGQRALGNRSILADPRKYETIDKINTQIKNRDFWMPFTPSMTDYFAASALKNPKNLDSPFMTMAFDLACEMENLQAVMHPADNTVRPQILKKYSNPKYYQLLQAVEAQIGLACLLNTSFNLHGDPIVESPYDALRTFKESKLDLLVFDNIMIERM